MTVQQTGCGGVLRSNYRFAGDARHSNVRTRPHMEDLMRRITTLVCLTLTLAVMPTAAASAAPTSTAVAMKHCAAC